MTLNVLYIPSLWEKEENEAVDMTAINAQLIKKLNVDGTNKMMASLDLNTHAITNVGQGIIKKLEVESIVAKEKCVVPDPIYSKQAANRSYVDNAVGYLVKPSGQKIENSVTAWTNDGKLTSTPIKIDQTGKQLQCESLKASTAEVGTVTGLKLPLRDDAAVNKAYVDQLIQSNIYYRDAFINSQSMSTVASKQSLLPMKPIKGHKMLAVISDGTGKYIKILEDAFCRIVVTGYNITSATDQVPNARVSLILNDTETLASKSFGRNKVSFDLIAQTQLSKGSKIGLQAWVIGNNTEKIFLKFSVTIEKLI